MKRAILVAGVAAALLLVPIVSAQTGGGFDLTWSTIDGGGGESTGGGFSLRGTIGQADAGALSGGGYTLSGGFWPGAAAEYRAYLPLALKTLN
jgi:hypothetical protein